MDVEFTVLTRELGDSLLRDRLMAILAGALAMIGIYGVIASMVARRRRCSSVSNPTIRRR